MAQIKRSARARTGGKLALFEVIQAAQAQGEGQLSDAVAPLVQASVQREPPPPEPAAQPAPVVAAPAPGTAAASIAASHALVTRQPIVLPVRPSQERRAREQGGISVLSFATACAGLIALVGAAFVIFQHFAREGAPQVASGSQPIPEVLDVGRPDAEASSGQANIRRDVQTQVHSGGSAPVTVPRDFRRTAGLNYVLVQSFAASEESHAIAMRDALLANGIPATIESGIKGWGNRLAVVGTVGFESYKTNPDYKAYVQRLQAVERTARAENKKIRRFDPTAFQWVGN